MVVTTNLTSVQYFPKRSSTRMFTAHTSCEHKIKLTVAWLHSSRVFRFTNTFQPNYFGYILFEQFSHLQPPQISTSAAKKLWDKSGVADMKMPVGVGVGVGGVLPPLQLHPGNDHQVWRDSTWSTQGEAILPPVPPRRSTTAVEISGSSGGGGVSGGGSNSHSNNNNSNGSVGSGGSGSSSNNSVGAQSAGILRWVVAEWSHRMVEFTVGYERNMFINLFFILFSNKSPRDSTGGLGVKMVEYVLCGSPTNNKDSSPLSGLEPRLRALKFDENDKVRDTAVTISNSIPIYIPIRPQSIDDKDAASHRNSSPFDANGSIKKEDPISSTAVVVANGGSSSNPNGNGNANGTASNSSVVVNGSGGACGVSGGGGGGDDDKGFK